MTEKKHTQPQHSTAKKPVEENTFDKVWESLDKQMDKLMKKWFVEKVVWNKVVKDVLWSKIMNDLDAKLKPNLKTIFTVLWRLSIIGWVLWVFWSFGSFWLFFRRGLWLVFFFYALLYLVFSLVAIVAWYGMIKFKVRAILVILAECWVSIVYTVLTAISWWRIWTAIINLLITLIFTVLILKNKELFKN